MVTFSSFVFIYVLGGLTFIPSVLVLGLCFVYFTSPVRTPEEDKGPDNDLADHDDGRGSEAFTSEHDGLASQLSPRSHEPDVASGYFAVCRDYVPGGVNGKPPERTTPIGSVVASESPSVYQSMYRSIFDRNKSHIPSIEGTKAGARLARKARNVFFVVLRHGHLMLYDDSEQLEVRHVISLAHHSVDIYAGGEEIPEGELWIKRNCIRMTRKRTVGELFMETRPFYLFSENCSEKEDFYHAMLQNQEKTKGQADSPPTPLTFNTKDMVTLVQQLHASEENLQTRWFNALLGRVFLAMYKTSRVEDFIRLKIAKKIARVQKPAFIKSINIRTVSMGDAAPLITNPRLKELAIDGDMTVEVDVKYQGNFKLEIAAVARIDLGPRFRAREVDLVMAGILKKLDGHLLIRAKPPPSNRLWIAFETPPKLELSIEPIVSSRQITYGVILRAIESRIREVVADTLVLPNWDDWPFADTTHQRFRGGIWADDQKLEPLQSDEDLIHQHNTTNFDEDSSIAIDSGPASPASPQPVEKSMSVPSLVDTPPSGLKARRIATAKSTISLDVDANGTTTSAEPRSSPKPKSMRSGSFASAAIPILSKEAAKVDSQQPQNKTTKHDATRAMKDISSRSQTASPVESPVGSLETTSTLDRVGKTSNLSSTPPHHFLEEADDLEDESTHEPSRKASSVSTNVSSTASNQSGSPPKHPNSNTNYGGSAPVNTTSQTDRRAAINASINSATTAARKWFASRNAVNSSQSSSPASTPKTALAQANENAISSSSKAGSPSQPIGRGQPLPPPGTPLPRPQRESKGWGTTSLAGLGLTKRKPIPSPQSTTAAGRSAHTDSPTSHVKHGSVDSPFVTSPSSEQTNVSQISEPERVLSHARRLSLPHTSSHSRRQRISSGAADDFDSDANGMLVIEAPNASDTSAPPSPGINKGTHQVQSTPADNTSNRHDQGDVPDGAEYDHEVFGMELDPEREQAEDIPRGFEATHNTGASRTRRPENNHTGLDEKASSLESLKASSELAGD